MSDLIERGDLISRNKVLGIIEEWYCSTHNIKKLNELAEILRGDAVYREIYKLPAVDAVEVVRCGKCQYYHKPHVLCDDGTEKDYSEFPKEAFGIAGLVNGKYGINVGGKCEREKNCGYAEDKSVFRKPTDFCCYGERRDDNAVD